MNTSTGLAGLVVMLSIADLLDKFPGTSRGSWAQMRYNGTGPRYYKIGKSIFYDEADVATWLEAQARTGTAAVSA